MNLQKKSWPFLMFLFRGGAFWVIVCFFLGALRVYLAYFFWASGGGKVSVLPFRTISVTFISIDE